MINGISASYNNSYYGNDFAIAGGVMDKAGGAARLERRNAKHANPENILTVRTRETFLLKRQGTLLRNLPQRLLHLTRESTLRTLLARGTKTETGF